MSEGRPLLLVVDDEADNLRSLHDLFRRDYQVATFQRGKEALAALDQLEPQVVMSDQRMPGMTGVELLREIRKRKPDATRLLFTGYTDTQTVVDAINEGHIFRYISKPWHPEELTAIVRQAFEQNALVRERRRLLAELRASNQRLQEANRLKSAFIEVASHELNTPVAVILGLADLWSLNMGPDADPGAVERVERIRRAGLRLAKTVERMFSLLYTDQLGEMLVVTDTDLSGLIRRTVDEIRPFLEGRSLEIVVSISDDLGNAQVDAAKVGDILTNLLANAIKFTPDGGRIEVRAQAEGADRVRIDVIDSGLGFTEAEFPHLFEPFFTGYDTRRHSSGEFEFGKRGIGLGLALVRRFVEMHGGTVSARRREPRGSEFSLSIPRHHRASAATGQSSRRSDGPDA